VNTGVRGTLVWQAVAGLAGSVAAGVWLGGLLALSVAYGVLLMVLNNFFLAGRIGLAGEADKVDGQRLLYSGAVSRFLGMLAALLLAYGLGLHLLAVAGGMLLAQIALFTYAASHVSSNMNTL